jgi:hypothetical protein
VGVGEREREREGERERECVCERERESLCMCVFFFLVEHFLKLLGIVVNNIFSLQLRHVRHFCLQISRRENVCVRV